MFMSPIDDTIEALKKIRRGVCCYLGNTETFCDCKYGVAKSKSERPWEDGGENTGCPELRSAIAYLTMLKPLQANIERTIGSPFIDSHEILGIKFVENPDLEPGQWMLVNSHKHKPTPPKKLKAVRVFEALVRLA